MPFKKGQSGNPKGRPKGSYNVLKADREVAKAVAKGLSMQEIVELISQKILDENISENQRAQFIKMYSSIKMDLLKLELNNDKQDKDRQDRFRLTELNNRASLEDAKAFRPRVTSTDKTANRNDVNKNVAVFSSKAK